MHLKEIEKQFRNNGRYNLEILNQFFITQHTLELVCQTKFSSDRVQRMLRWWQKYYKQSANSNKQFIFVATFLYIITYVVAFRFSENQ